MGNCACTCSDTAKQRNTQRLYDQEGKQQMTDNSRQNSQRHAAKPTSPVSNAIESQTESFTTEPSQSYTLPFTISFTEAGGLQIPPASNVTKADSLITHPGDQLDPQYGHSIERIPSDHMKESSQSSRVDVVLKAESIEELQQVMAKQYLESDGAFSGLTEDEEDEHESSYSENELQEIEKRKSELLSVPNMNSAGSVSAAKPNLLRPNTNSEWEAERIEQVESDMTLELKALAKSLNGQSISIPLGGSDTLLSVPMSADDLTTSEEEEEDNENEDGNGKTYTVQLNGDDTKKAKQKRDSKLYRIKSQHKWTDDDLKATQKEMYDQLLHLNQVQLSNSASPTNQQ